jgi:hypothetical protein
MKKTVFILMLFISSYVLSQNKVMVPLSFDFYYTYDMVNTALKELHKSFPELTKLEEVGKSEEGRIIYCMTINNPKTGDELSKPGIYVDGNIHGNEIQAGEVCLYLLNYLLTNYEKNKEITELVDKKCFYVIPVVNVDGRYHFFADPNSPHSSRTFRIPIDDDNDGLIDEDPDDDLDGDGNITQMRKKDPFGQWKTDPEDPRLMIRVKPGEKGEWSLLGNEGIDNDGDGRINEDDFGYVDGNRNWPFDWQPSYVQQGAGEYPFQSLGLKAMAEYIEKKLNICVAWAFHNNGGMILRGPSAKTFGDYPASDVKVYDYLGQNAEKIVPGYRYMLSWRDLYPTHGDFIEWMSVSEGAFGFVGELFVTETETYHKEGDKQSEQPGDYNKNERERLKFNDHLAQGELYIPWKAFKHPDYGEIEIGGWAKMSSRLPAPFMLKDLVHRNASAVIFSAKNAPEIRMEIIDVKKVSDKLNRIRVRLINEKAMPSMSAQAVKTKLYPMDFLKASGKNMKVIAGGRIINLYTNEVEYKENKPEIQFLSIPGFGKTEYEFLVSGSGNLQIEYESRHAGKISKSVKIVNND